MATLNSKVKKYLEANSKVYLDELNNFVLRNDGSGDDYIKSWNVSGLTEPTEEQLATYEDEANAEEALNTVYSNRRSEYPPIGDQLDMLWHSIDKNPDLKTKFYDFYEACKAVKVKYPK